MGSIEKTDGIEYIFGYGSLIWKPPPHVVEQIPCYIKGFTRRFAQFSHDHRGTSENPGVVVTLVPTSEWKDLLTSELESDDKFIESEALDLVVWGIVFKIDSNFKKDVKDYLDEREKDGYELIEVDVFGSDQDNDNKEKLIGKSLVYVGHTTNPSFCGPKKLDELASIIHKSVGPSGTNKEYLYNLNEHVQTLGPKSSDAKDEYLSKLTELVLKLDSE